jgi:hypothetical protein
VVFVVWIVVYGVYLTVWIAVWTMDSGICCMDNGIWIVVFNLVGNTPESI